MFETLFPGWSNPELVALIVACRVVLNASLAGITASAAGIRSAPGAAAAGLTVLSALTTILALRPGILGLRASYVEILLQLLLLGVVGYAIYIDISAAQAVPAVLVAAGAIALLLVMIPIYGEAFVAP